jgi:hypothetical protein
VYLSPVQQVSLSAYDAVGRAGRVRRGLRAGQDGLEPDRVLPVVPAVLEQHVAGIGQDLVQAHLIPGERRPRRRPRRTGTEVQLTLTASLPIAIWQSALAVVYRSYRPSL